MRAKLRRPFLPQAVASVVIVFASTSVSAFTIDNFEEGAFSVQATGTDVPGAVDTQSDLAPGNVASGQRRVLVNTDADDPPASASLSLTPSDDAAEFFGPPRATAGVRFEYEFASPFDITDGGSADRFVVAISEVNGAGGQVGFNIFVGGVLAFTGNRSVSGPGAVTFPYSDLKLPDLSPANLDLQQVDEIRLVGNFTLPTGFTGEGASFQVADIAAIPEPSVGVLLAFGSVALVMGLRRR